MVWRIVPLGVVSIFLWTAVSAAAVPSRQALLHSVPLGFERDHSGVFVASPGLTRAMRLTRGGNVTMWSPDGTPVPTMTFVGAAPVDPIGEQPQPLAVRRFIGHGADAQTAAHARFARLRYRQIYPGIDLVFHGTSGVLEHDFMVSPGADPSRIRLRIAGAAARLNSAGDLLLETPQGDVVWRRPVVYQETAGGRAPVKGEFLVRNGEVTFHLGAYDRSRTLVIDPELAYATYLGAGDNEAARAVAVDAAGNSFVVGYTSSTTLAVTRGVVQPAFGGRTTNYMTGDAFIAKFDSSGNLLALTYLGGSGDDAAGAVTLDAAGNVYVTGYTNSQNFPISTGAAQTGYGGAGGNTLIRLGDAFVTKLDNSLSRIIYSTYLGGSRDELGLAIAVDGSGNAFVTGTTLSDNFPVNADAFQNRNRGFGGQPITDFAVPFFIAGDAFIAKLNPAGSQVLASTFLGGTRDDTPMAIKIDPSGNIVVAGTTISSDFPTSATPFQRASRGFDPENLFFHLGDGFVTKLNPTLTAAIFSTYLGGTGDDSITAMAMDSSGAIYLTGTTTSVNFPVTSGAYRTRFSGPSQNFFAERVVGDAWAGKMDANGGVVFATYIGGTGDDAGYGIALGPGGNIYITGQTESQDFPVTTDAVQKTFGGRGGQTTNGDYWGDGFVVTLSPDGARQMFSTFVGGNADDTLQGIAVDANGVIYAAGGTLSRNFPVTGNAAQRTYAGNSGASRLRGDAVLIRITPGSPGQPAISAITNAASGAVGTVAPGMIFTGYGANLGPATLAGAALDASGKLATQVANAQILFDNVPAPWVYVSAGQISAVTPYSVAGKTTSQVVAVYNGQRSNPFTVRVAPALPGLFTLNQAGTGQAAAINQDGTFNTPSNPAPRGSVITLFGTGEGQTVPAGVDGLVAGGAPPVPALPLSATVSGKPAEVAYKGGAPGTTSGLLQLNLFIPPDAASGEQPVIITIGGVSSPSNVTISIAE